MYPFFKRFFDIAASVCGLVLLSPLLAFIALAIRLESKGPVIFKQERLGRFGRVFQFYKFRSMVVGAEHTGSGVYSNKGDARVTRVGQFIRATSLDELPQLLNILKGEMSFIGPRPPLTYHPWPIDKYSPEQKKMFDVRPGITGWAQINGRKEVEWNHRIELSVWYVEHLSFRLDVYIFFMTALKVFAMSDNLNRGKTLADGAPNKVPSAGLPKWAPMKLMYITNRADVAEIAQNTGVDRIFIDMETRGKAERQKGYTVKSNHTLEDVRRLRPLIDRAELLVRVNPMGDDSKNEIDQTVEAGADLIMLPMFKTTEEAERFIRLVGGRAKTVLLIETREAVERADEILALPELDEIYVGLNDLHLSCGLKFMFEFLSNGVLDELAVKIRRMGKPFGFGGIAALGQGTLRADDILAEHRRLGSDRVILSRTFCNLDIVTEPAEIESVFRDGVAGLRDYQRRLEEKPDSFFDENHRRLAERIEEIRATL